MLSQPDYFQVVFVLVVIAAVVVNNIDIVHIVIVLVGWVGPASNYS